MTDVLNCPVCAGVGVLDDPTRTCPPCDGTGIVTVEQYMRLRGFPKALDQLPEILDVVAMARQVAVHDSTLGALYVLRHMLNRLDRSSEA